MRLAICIDDNGEVARLAEGKKIVIYDSDSGTEKMIDNPGPKVTQAKRSAALSAIIEEGARTVVTIPASFCEISYEKAQQNEIKFIRLNEPIPYKNIVKNLTDYISIITDKLPENEIMKVNRPH
ncbi:MAG: hypothetical protein QME46_10025 [Thermoanaerobacteraceae bacterium]|nr:hypothetical protein [Thermoanaerobacteraceae bacterium]